jgi:4-amino-4-deoxy-L-arabinose transferase-like glycosyltransferase
METTYNVHSFFRRHVWAAVLAVLLFFFLALDSLVGDSPTMDEQNHLARGVAFLRSGDPRFSLEHPPLLNVLSALPVLTLPEIRLPFDHSSWERREGWYEFADLLLWQYNHDATRMIFLARLPIVFLTLGLALVGYRFGGQLWGRTPALVAFWLLLFEPNLLAHGRYATTDLGGTLFAFLTLYLLWQLWHEEGWAWRRWLVAGLVMGLALGSKFSVLVFVPAWFLLAVWPLYPRPANGTTSFGRSSRRLLQLAAAGVLAFFVVWILYGFEWGHFTFVSPQLLPLNNWSGPMPTYWAGIEQIGLLSGSGRSQTFLLGQFSDDGFLAYFPVAFLVKTPLIILLLLPVAILLLLRTPSTRHKAIFLLVPVIWFFLVTLQSALNIGYRHLLPILPNWLLLVASLSGSRVRWLGWFDGREVTTANQPSEISKGRLVGWSAVALLLLATLWIHPHYLSFFNLAAGGPANGFQILVDSNVDWGQDLLRLKAWMDDHEVDSVRLAWFGTADPAYYGVQYEPLPGIGRDEFFRRWWDVPFDTDNPQPGVYAISATNLWELPLREEEKGVFAWFRKRPPDDRVGYSILIYDLRQSAGVFR